MRLAAEVDGEKLPDTEFAIFSTLRIDAGADTARNLDAGDTPELIEPADERRRR